MALCTSIMSKAALPGIRMSNRTDRVHVERERESSFSSLVLVGGGDRQMFNRLEAWRAAPLDFGFVHRQLEFRPAPEQGLQRAGSLDARELMAKAEMNSGAEGN